jgi:hypothetical protein
MSRKKKQQEQPTLDMQWTCKDCCDYGEGMLEKFAYDEGSGEVIRNNGCARSQEKAIDENRPACSEFKQKSPDDYKRVVLYRTLHELERRVRAAKIEILVHRKFDKFVELLQYLDEDLLKDSEEMMEEKNAD